MQISRLDDFCTYILQMMILTW